VDYAVFKQVHMGLALLSVGGFILRWNWFRRHSTLSFHWLTKSLPHVIDTLFLATGLMLAFTIGQYPLITGWLSAKVAGLLLYILLGMAAMSRRVSHSGQRIAFLAALMCFSWIISVARLKSPWGYFGF